MSDNEQKPAKIIRTSSGSTRLTASSDKGGTDKGKDSASKAPASTPETKAAPAAPKAAPESKGSASSTTAAPATKSGADAWNSPAGASATSSATRVQPAVTQSSTGTTQHVGTGAASAPSGPAPAAAATRTAASGPDHASSGVADDLMDSSSVKASSAGVKVKGKAKKKGPRTVRLTIASLDPWSVMKMSFLLSAALGIATVIAALVLWLVLQATGTLQGMEQTIGEIAGTESAKELLGIFSLGRVLSFAFIVAFVNIVLMTALSTLFAFLYNIAASIVGGFHVTLTDD